MGKLLILTLLMGGMLAPVAAQSGADSRLVLQPESKIWVEGTSTVRSYTCESSRLTANVAVDASSARIADLSGAVKGVSFSVPVASLDCGNNTMDSHLRDALKASSNPDIRFRTTRHDVVANGAGKGRVQLAGRLSIAGQEQTINLTADATEQANGALRVRGQHALEMTNYGVTPPRLMMGTLRVHDPVVVHFDLLLRP